MRERICINNNWQFTEQWNDAFRLGDTEEGKYETVRLPHTCKEVPFHYFNESDYQIRCGYRRIIDAPAEWECKRIILTVGAAAHRAEVYLNGEKIGEHNCGYTAFSVELKGLLYGQKNILAICADSRETLNIPPFGHVIDYMTYGGLYREVWLDVTEKERIADVFARPQVPEGRLDRFRRMNEKQAVLRLPGFRFRGTLKTELVIEGGPENLLVRQTVYRQNDPDRTVKAEKTLPLSECRKITRDITGSPYCAFCTELSVPDAELWDAVNPVNYILKTELFREDVPVDCTETHFGFRSAVFHADGFFLNGRPFKIRGLNRHQSYPYVGYAMPDSMQRRDAELLKNELGLNAVRTSHYPQSQAFIDACDELGLLVFTEIPGWQHIGDEQWKMQAVENTREMVLQYRNHPSVILWGVRINESADDDEFYAHTNAAAWALDETRPTGGVRCHKNSSLLEDVYTYNDFSHSGTNAGCEPKRKVTSDPDRAYLITEYNGHMFPTKSFDDELHRRDHALRHARVLNDIAGERDIAGGFGWCFADYNTHKDFGSGDRICYHGVMDMFRNPKTAAAVYASQQEKTPVLEISSSMDIGDHPSGNPGRIFAFTNAEQVRVYKNDRLVRTYEAENKEFPELAHPPVEIDDFIGDALKEREDMAPLQARLTAELLNYAARFGFEHLPPEILAKAAVLMQRYHMTFDDAYRLYGRYIGGWGDSATVWRFEAVTGGRIVKTVVKEPVRSIHLEAEADHTGLCEKRTYDAAAVRLTMRDQNGNILPYYQGFVKLETEGPVRIIGPETAVLRGGMGGAYIRTAGEPGEAALRLTDEDGNVIRIGFTVSI